jgi:hypothetical protein
LKNYIKALAPERTPTSDTPLARNNETPIKQQTLEGMMKEANKWLTPCPGCCVPFFYDGAAGERLYSAFV